MRRFALGVFTLLLAATNREANASPSISDAKARASASYAAKKAPYDDRCTSETENPTGAAIDPRLENGGKGQERYYVSLYGAPKYKPNFRHFDFVNPHAPKGGTLKLSGLGTFDSLNPFVLKGIADSNIASLTYDSLLKSSGDETAVAYGLLAKSILIAPDGASARLTLREKAAWPDGKPVTPEDVVFTLKVLKEQGDPFYKNMYRDVTSVEATGKRDVTFHFSDSSNRELPLIVGSLPILPKHLLEGKNFADYTDDAIPGSGPYALASHTMGRTLTFKRRKDYWGKDLPINKGMHNFDNIRIDYYKDAVVALEALKAGEYDYRYENSSKNWATAYNIPQIQQGKLVKEELPDLSPTGMQAYVLNTRRDLFKDPTVREAFQYLMNFEWMNKTLFYDAYRRNRSFFGNSRFEAKGLPSKAELALMRPLKQDVPKRAFTEEYHPPVGSEQGTSRQMLKKAVMLLKKAGWTQSVKGWSFPDGSAVPEVEFLLVSPLFERVTAPVIDAMKKIGLRGRMRIVDMPQYAQRMKNFDFDIVTHWFLEGESPGNELLNFWTSESADANGSQNYAGVKNKAVDALVGKVLTARGIEELETATHALDRTLQWGFYVIPQWHNRSFRLVHTPAIAHPNPPPPKTIGMPARWWRKR